MATRTAYVPTAGTAITAANHLKFPGGWIGYAEVTSNQTGMTSLADITSLSVSVTAGSARRLLVDGFIGIQQVTSNGTPVIYIAEDSFAVQSAATSLTASSQATINVRSVRTPSAGSRVYKLQGSTGAGTLSTVATATSPAFILVQDIGPSA